MRRNKPQHAHSGFLMLPCVLALALAAASNSACAGGNAPALTQVRTLTSALLEAMHAGSSGSVTKEYRQLQPVIEEVFALPLMTRLSIGPDWAGFAPRERQALVRAFSRYTIANYAHNFHRFDGQQFEIDPRVITRGADKIIQTSLTSPGNTPVALLYRMREVAGTWRVIDVYYNGVSQLTLHRVQFASAIGAGGAFALIAYLNGVSETLLK